MHSDARRTMQNERTNETTWLVLLAIDSATMHALWTVKCIHCHRKWSNTFNNAVVASLRPKSDMD